MNAIANFKNALRAKKAVKIIAGIDNFDAENVLKVVKRQKEAVLTQSISQQAKI